MEERVVRVRTRPRELVRQASRCITCDLVCSGYVWSGPVLSGLVRIWFFFALSRLPDLLAWGDGVLVLEVVGGVLERVGSWGWFSPTCTRARVRRGPRRMVSRVGEARGSTSCCGSSQEVLGSGDHQHQKSLEYLVEMVWRMVEAVR